MVYLLSDEAPDPTGFVELHGWPIAGAWETRDYAPVLRAVTAGRRFRFRLRANPTHAVRLPHQNPDARTKRLAHVTETQQLAWFHSRADSWGIDVGDVDGGRVTVTERKFWSFGRGGRTVTLGTAVFEGDLTIVEPEDFRRHMVAGFGPAKAYGCGLLTIARMPQ
jgi:CRISPR system Cascade subunit CasE